MKKYNTKTFTRAFITALCLKTMCPLEGYATDLSSDLAAATFPQEKSKLLQIMSGKSMLKTLADLKKRSSPEIAALEGLMSLDTSGSLSGSISLADEIDKCFTFNEWKEALSAARLMSESEQIKYMNNYFKSKTHLIISVVDLYTPESKKTIAAILQLFSKHRIDLTLVVDFEYAGSSGTFFMQDWTSVKKLCLVGIYPQYTRGYFLKGCNSLTHLEVPQLESVDEGRGFLEGCTSLTHLTLSNKLQGQPCVQGIDQTKVTIHWVG